VMSCAWESKMPINGGFCLETPRSGAGVVEVEGILRLRFCFAFAKQNPRSG
jgi:hypothetical protein